MPGRSPFAATVEDCLSDDGDVKTQPSSPQKAANVAGRRNPYSHEAGAKIPPAVPETGSDSGYSSRTGATVGSTESVFGPRKGSLPYSSTSTTRQDARRDRSRTESQKADSSFPSRSVSRQSKTEARECIDPCCEKCTMSRRTPLDTPWNLALPNYPQNYSPYPNNGPPSPEVAYAHANYPPPAIAPARPRRRTSAARPASYHPGMATDGYWVQLNPTYEPTPPPSYESTPLPSATYPVLGTNAPTTQYRPPASAPSYSSPSSPYETTRPDLSHRSSEYSSRSRPLSGYGPPLVSYDQASYAAAPGPVSYSTGPNRSSITQQTFDRVPPRDDNRLYDEGRARMPPPPRRTNPSRGQPVLGYSGSNQAVPTRQPTTEPAGRSQSRRSYSTDAYESYDHYDPDATVPSLRGPSRPSLSAAKSTSYSNGADASTRVVESATGRRYSYMGHEARAELERRRTRAAEDYQQQISASARKPSAAGELTEEAVSRASRRKSSHSGSDQGSHDYGQSRSRRGSSFENGNVDKKGEEFKIQVNAREGFSLDFSGDMKGRTISMLPREDGTAELIISNARDETSYSKAGSIRSSTNTSRTGRSGGARDGSTADDGRRYSRSSRRSTIDEER